MSCNLVQDGLKANSDTLSEISETGTGTLTWNSCYDSREDLREFANKIGLKDASELYQETFKVDRKKLEQMLIGESNSYCTKFIF